jgi:hypothetical protein
VSVADDVQRQITKRLVELKPLVDEYHQLEAIVRKLASRDGGGRSPGRSSTRARSRRSNNGRRRGRPRGSGTRSGQALALVQAKPGITIPRMAKEMGITPNYLYRVLPELAKDGKSKRTARAGSPLPRSDLTNLGARRACPREGRVPQVAFGDLRLGRRGGVSPQPTSLAQPAQSGTAGSPSWSCEAKTRRVGSFGRWRRS